MPHNSPSNKSVFAAFLCLVASLVFYSAVGTPKENEQAILPTTQAQAIEGAAQPETTTNLAPNYTAQRAKKKEVETTVYVTDTGKKYHRASCQHLRYSSHPTPLSEARRYYDPCKVCRPPQ